MGRRGAGFTLIEIAIVLVIVGLLLGGVLAGQQLIQSARVRNLVSQQDGAKAAFFGFQDRYRALPGDYGAADVNINCGTPCLNGNGNGRIEPNASSGVTHEEILAWTHLSAAGFLNGSYVMAASGVSAPAVANTPQNPYGAFVQLAYDGLWGSSDHATTPVSRHSVKTGNQIPVQILAEIDRKIDDGRPYTGSFQFSSYAGSGTAPAIGGSDDDSCTNSDDPSGTWNETMGQGNCGAASLL
jgi:prepilin-type N-terminal cleavage/methylation domain-containing protein